MSAMRRNPRARKPDPLLGVGLAVALLVLGACAGEVAERSASTATAAATATPLSWTHFDVPQAPAVTAQLTERGRQVFEENCASCHGAEGAADGLCAAFLSPQPRDFTTGVYRFKTTPGSEMPTDADLYRTVSLGIHSTGMPPWQYLLTEEDRWALVAHLKTFSDKFERFGAGTPVDLGSEPAQRQRRDDRRAAASCTPRRSAASATATTATATAPRRSRSSTPSATRIPPRNYHKAADFKRGHTLRDIALTIHTGNNGTPMPAFDGALSEEQVWDLAAYVHSLAEPRFAGGGTPAAAILGARAG